LTKLVAFFVAMGFASIRELYNVWRIKNFHESLDDLKEE